MLGIMGATGNIGSAVVDYLLERDKAVLAMTHDPDKADDLRTKGAEVAIVDVHDADALRDVFRKCRRAFLLNPPADVSGDTDAEERATVRSIVEAVEGSGLELVVAVSAYGAQPGERLGDLGVLHEFEQGLEAQSVPCVIQRGAYYFSNWGGLLETVKKEGVLPTMLPAKTALPMVAPVDLGCNAGRLLIEHDATDETLHVEGPQRYSPDDVAAAFGNALGKSVQTRVIPESDWENSYRDLGFSAAAAESYSRMTKVSVDGGFTMPDDPIRGTLTLQEYVDALVDSGRSG